MLRVARRVLLVTCVELLLFVVLPTGDRRGVEADTPQLNGHNVVLDSNGKLVSWLGTDNLAYDQVLQLVWGFLLSQLPSDPNTPPALNFSCCEYQPDWPNNPASKDAMLTEAALIYYAYSGNPNVIIFIQRLLDYDLAHGLTPNNWLWPSVPYASADPGARTFQGANDVHYCGYVGCGTGDGYGVIEPDKVGELGYQFLRFYEYSGNVTYLNAAINCANALATNVQAGDASDSPWPFRVNAQNGNVVGHYTADVIHPIMLLDELIRLNQGNVSSYQNARNLA